MDGSPDKAKRITVKIHEGTGASHAFQPPDVVASRGQHAAENDGWPAPAPLGSDPADDGNDTKNTGKKGRKEHWWRKLKHLSKKQWAIVAIVVILLAGGVTALVLHHHKPAPKPAPAKVKPAAKPAPKPAPLLSTLTGLPISDPAINQRPVTAVMIENSLQARPQSGLDQAGVVFEAVAEAGITRFLALYQDTAPAYIGPVRSVRPYYLQWLMGFDAAVAHVGGSPEALADIKTWGVKNLDQFAYGGYYTRISSRYAPHNVYTSMANLNAIEAKAGYGPSSYTGFPRKADAPSKTPNATSIDFAISSSDYNAHFDYDAGTNSYARAEGGSAHMETDQNGAQTQIRPKVVLALIMPKGIEADDLHTSYNTLGSGQMFFFQDGTVGTGTWTKPNNSAQFSFTTANGQPVKLNAGQTWITVLDNPNEVSYK